MFRNFSLQIASILLLVLLGACGPDCDKAVEQLAMCSEETEAGRVTFSSRTKIDCVSGETPTYFDCWENVDASNCDDATRICLQYADR